MAVEKTTLAFSDLLSNIVDNRGKTCPVAENGLPLIATNCVKNDTLYPVFEKVRYVDESTYLNWFRGHPEPGDIIFVTKGSPGNVCWVPDPVSFCIAQDMVAIRADKKVVDPKYLFALLRSPKTQASILNMHVGTMIPHFKKGDFKNLHLDVATDRGVQKAIGEIYFYFCEKIELNRQINTTLESMAQALFKSWFVDFDPVIDNALAAGNDIPEPLQAKANKRKALGDKRKPLPDGLQQQFPDRFVFTEEMGWVPEGWQIEELPRVIDFLEGPGIRNWQYTEETDGIKFINIRCIQNGDLQLTTANRITRDEALGKYAHFQLEVDDIVVSTSGTLGRYAFVRQEHLPLSLNTSVIRFRPIPNISTLHYVAGYTATRLQFELETRASGSVQRNFGPMHLKQISMLLPPFAILEAHDGLAMPLFRKRQATLQSIDNLANLRDTLLPKLLSGELRIPEAEKQVAEAV
jgi:type I restriction enzyme S subunit